MNFDFEYVTTQGNSSTAHSVIIDYQTLFIILGLVIVVLLIGLIVFGLSRRKKAKSDSNGNEGVVFCRKCFNEYDCSLFKCQYCKNKRIRRGYKYGDY